MVKKAVKVSKKAAPKMKEVSLDLTEHIVIPLHEKLDAKEAQAVLEKYQATPGELPKISLFDPAIMKLGVRQGDIIRITRKSRTAGKTIFYRGVVDE